MFLSLHSNQNTKKMKAQHYLLISIFCFVAIVFHYMYNSTIIHTPYMFWLLMLLFGVGGYCGGVGVAKLVKK